MINFYGQEFYLRSKKNKIKRLLQLIAHDHKYKIRTVDYIFVNDEEILELNKSALNHDYYTDIITFDYTQENKIEGEIYISIDRVQDNAKKFGEVFHVELLRVIAHGLLHMVGYKDKSNKQKTEMRKKEEIYLNYYNKLFHVEQKNEYRI